MRIFTNIKIILTSEEKAKALDEDCERSSVRGTYDKNIQIVDTNNVNDDYTSVFHGNMVFRKAYNGSPPYYYPNSYLLYLPNKGSMQLWKYRAIPQKKGRCFEAEVGFKNLGRLQKLTFKSLGL